MKQKAIRNQRKQEREREEDVSGEREKKEARRIGPLGGVSVVKQTK